MVQPAGVSWNAPFKARYRELYEEWLQEPERGTDLTPRGNARAPSKLKMVTWTIRAWEQVSSETIVRSFDACGITAADTNRIHCTKPGGMAEDARDMIDADISGEEDEVQDAEGDDDVDDFLHFPW